MELVLIAFFWSTSIGIVPVDMCSMGIVSISMPPSVFVSIETLFTSMETLLAGVMGTSSVATETVFIVMEILFVVVFTVVERVFVVLETVLVIMIACGMRLDVRREGVTESLDASLS